jgi:H+/gluconate symporter-like permease
MDSSVLLIIIIPLILLNIFVSIYIFRHESLDQFQKVGQTIIVWLIPFVGAIVLFLFLRSQNDEITRAKPKFGGGSSSSHEG